VSTKSWEVQPDPLLALANVGFEEVAGAKQSATRAARVENHAPRILKGWDSMIKPMKRESLAPGHRN
jgi:hypothetical protein